MSTQNLRSQTLTKRMAAYVDCTSNAKFWDRIRISSDAV